MSKLIVLSAVVLIAVSMTVVRGSDPNDPYFQARRNFRIKRAHSHRHGNSQAVPTQLSSASVPVPAPVAEGLGTIIPEQIHIAYGGVPSASSFRVSWFTYNDTTTSVVKYGTVSGQYTQSDTGASVTYFPDSFTHHVLLTQLSTQPASTTWYYVVGDSDTQTWSQEMTFVSPRATGDNTTPLKLAVFGDMVRASLLLCRI